MHNIYYFFVGSVIVKCAQNGKKFPVKVKNLSPESFEPLKRTDLKAGASLMADVRGKPYPVTFEAFAGENLVLFIVLSTRQLPSQC